MPYLAGSPLVDTSANQIQDATGNDLAEPDWDFAALTATLNNQQSETLARIGEPASTLFGYAAEQKTLLEQIRDWLTANGLDSDFWAAVARELRSPIVDWMLTRAVSSEPVTNDTLFGYILKLYSRTGPISIADNLSAQSESETQALLDAINAIEPGGGAELEAKWQWDKLLWPVLGGAGLRFHGQTEFPQAAYVEPGVVPAAGETRASYLARLVPIPEWSKWGDDDLYSYGLTGPNDSNRWVFPVTEAEWIRVGGAPDAGGEPGEVPNLQPVLDAIADLRGGTATVQNAYDDVEGARSDLVDLRGGTATVQNVLDAVNALEFTEPPTVEQIATAVWAYLLTGISAGTRLTTASELELDLSGVLTAIDNLRGGTATVQGVQNAIDALEIADVPTALEVATAVWAYLTNGNSAATQLNAAASHPSVPSASDNAAAVWAYAISAEAASTLLLAAATGSRLNLAPIYPGNAKVEMGTPVPFTDSFTVDTAMDGCIMAVTTEPTRAGQYVLGNATYYYGVGRLAFGDDQGRVEPWVYTGFPSALYLPRTMKRAYHVHVQVDKGMEGTLTPFTIVP